MIDSPDVDVIERSPGSESRNFLRVTENGFTNGDSAGALMRLLSIGARCSSFRSRICLKEPGCTALILRVARKDSVDESLGSMGRQTWDST
jgi:hypothetical protein